VCALSVGFLEENQRCDEISYCQALPPEANAHVPSSACYIEEIEMNLFLGRHIECRILRLPETYGGTLCCLYEAIVGPQSVAEEAIPVDVATRDAPTRF